MRFTALKLFGAKTQTLTREENLISPPGFFCNASPWRAEICDAGGLAELAPALPSLALCVRLSHRKREERRRAGHATLTVQYDAAYRSLLQFAGSFDAFANRFQGDLLEPIRQSMSLISQLSRIPCFLSQCNE